MKNVEKKKKDQNGLIGVIEIIVIAVVLAAVGYAGYRIFLNKKDNSGQKTSTASNETSSAEASKSKTWQKGDLAISGNYADADAVTLGDGRYRLYYSLEPEVPGFNRQVYSSVSTDGNKWTKEEVPGSSKQPSRPSLNFRMERIGCITKTPGQLKALFLRTVWFGAQNPEQGLIPAIPRALP